MTNTMRIELPLRYPSRLLNNCKTMGDLRKKYPNIIFHKYIFVDPADSKLKGVNPPDDVPLVKDAYITIVGSYEDVLSFAKEATEEE